MSQPKWRLIANIGDEDALDYGAILVWVDDTGVYPPEVECFDPEVEPGQKVEVFRFVLEPCTYIDGILSDNPFHPGFAAWFADGLKGTAETCGATEAEFIEALTGTDIIAKARAWHDIGSVHGFRNLDDYPLQLTRQELCRRYVWLHSALASLRDARREVV